MANILVVDDAKVIREMFIMILQNEGHTVTTAEDGALALEACRQATFDLIFSDVNMPNMSGISFVSKVRRLPQYEHTPILMVTTESSTYKKEKSKSMGANGWIQKPLAEDRILKAVRKILGKA